MDHFRNREGGDVAGDALLRHLRGDLAEDIAAFIEARIVGGEVRRRLVAGGVLELHLRELGRDLDGRSMKPNEVVKISRSRSGPALDGALGIRAFRHVFEELRLDLVAELLFEQLAADIMRLRPAAIGLRADIDEADLELVGGCEAPAKPTIAAVVAVSARRVFSFYPCRFGLNVFLLFYRSGTKAFPSDAGVLISVSAPIMRDDDQHDNRREIGQRRQKLRGHADAKSLRMQLADRYGTEQIAARKQPASGRQEANTTSASAIQPRPAVMFSTHCGV
jgi:hypothetical protein